MFKPQKGGSKEIVHGIEMYLPAPPPLHEIRGFDLPKKEQKWFRVGYPDFWDEVFEEEAELREADEDYRDPRLEDFREQEWRRRLNGFWFMNNGKKTYITGTHYKFLEWVKLDVGYPKFYEFARKNYYFTQYCIEDLFCLGYFKVGPRGFGKTMEEITIQLDIMTKPPHRSKGAIQSKSGNDAFKVFKKMVEIYNELPEFFKPESNHGSNPEKRLSFFRDKVKGKKAKKVKQDEDKELKNEIVWEVAKETALDGDTLVSVIQEEIGKSDPKEQCDVYKRIQVNRFCVYRNNIKRGIIQCTSTIEEMKEGGAEAYRVWQSSDFNKKSDNGFTTTGLYRAFTSALDTTVIDEYGMSDRDAAFKIHESERRLRVDDPNELASYIRKNPYNSDEAFMEDGDGCEFNAYILNKRLEELQLKEPVTIGDFEWTNGRDSEVVFMPNPKGRFKAAWLPYEKSQSNLVEMGPIIANDDGSKIQTWRPKNDLKFRIGTDTIDHGLETVDKRVSDAAAYVFMMFDISMDTDPEKRYSTEDTKDDLSYKNGKLKWRTYLPIVEYVNRTDNPEDFYEHMIKVCRFFGCQILPETQKRTIITWFRNRGYGEFIKYRPKDTFTNDTGNQNTPGIASVEPIIQQYLGLIKTYIMNHGHRIPFKNLVIDLLRFRRKRIRVHDATVGFGFTLMATLGEAKHVPQAAEVQDYFRTYKINGSQTELAR